VEPQFADRPIPKGRIRTSGRILLLALLLSGGCEPPPPPPPSDLELRTELGIPDDVRIHSIALSGRGDETRIVPPSLEIRQGEVVQIVVADRRTHLIRFEEDLDAPLRDFLQKSGQSSFPPLLERGARIVLSFAGAPPGRYSFLDEGNGPPVVGEIRVILP
jgi:hypothetical protein